MLAGLRFRPAATLAVLLALSALVLSDPSPMFAALSGLSAAAYLVLRHAVGAPAGVVTATPPTMIAAVGFAFVGVVATSFAPQLPWSPLLAPVVVFAIYAWPHDRSGATVRWPPPTRGMVRLTTKGVRCRLTRPPWAHGPSRKPFEWTDRDTLLYALGVGAGTQDLAFTTENSHDMSSRCCRRSPSSPARRSTPP